MGNDEGIIKDNVFHRRLGEVRSSSITEEQMTAIEELNKPVQRTMFSESEEVKVKRHKLTLADVERIAYFDDNTYAYNFRYLYRRIDREVKRSKRYNRPLSILIVAFLGFKRIAREHGESTKDEAIFNAANMLIDAIRIDVDLVGRYGDDRFILALPETPGTGAAILAERIRKKFEATPLQYRWHKLQLEASVGISYFPGLGTESDELIAKADLACDLVLEKGGNGTAFCPES